MKMSDVRSRQSCALGQLLCGRAVQKKGLFRAAVLTSLYADNEQQKSRNWGNRKNIIMKTYLLLPYDRIVHMAADKRHPGAARNPSGWW